MGRLTERKGLAPFVTDVLPLVLRDRPDAQLVVIGDEPTHALQPGVGGQREIILAAARAVGAEARVHLLGRCGEDELQAAYAAADAHVFPVLDLPGDVEGFGMVALEAAALGLPTVAYAVGGVPDAVGSDSGRLVAPGDAPGFAAALGEVLGASHDPARRAACRAFAAARSWSHFERELVAALEDAP